MRIESVRIRNFRSFADVTIPLDDYTCLVGPNGCGKSTVLIALNIFFRETSNATTDLTQLVQEDFHNKDTSIPVEITVTFGDLSEDAQDDFSHYFRQGKLVVTASASFNDESGTAKVMQYGQRLGIRDFGEFFRADKEKAKVPDLTTIYVKLQQKFEGLPDPGTKDSMISALHDFEGNHPDLSELIPSEDQFYGISKGANRLEQYVQWVYVPAVKDATTEQLEARNTALGKLLERTVRARANFEDDVNGLRREMRSQYQELLDKNQHVLEDLSAALQIRLSEWAHPDATIRLEWRQDQEKSVRVEEPFAQIIAGEGDFEGELARFGHGLQRSYLLALLQELAGSDDTITPTLILGCEEPELYQHPPQVRHLASVLKTLSEGNSQILLSTHSPVFVTGEGFENVRMFRKENAGKECVVRQMTFAEIASAFSDATGKVHIRPTGILAKIHQALQPALSEMFFAPRLVLVEGLEDSAYITAYINLLEKAEEFRRIGCHIVPVGGKSELVKPVIIAKHLGISTYLVFDADADKEDKNGSRAMHEADNRALLKLVGQTDGDAMPSSTAWGTGFVMWPSDIGAVVKEDIGAAEWTTFQAKADEEYGNIGGLRKHHLHIGTALTLAWEAGKRSDSLDRLCGEMLDLAVQIH